MAIEFVESSKKNPTQDRVDVMLRWFHKDVPEYEESPNKSEFLEDRKWADGVIADLRWKDEIPGKAEAKKALEDILPSIKKTAGLYREKWAVLLGNTATADASHTIREKGEKFSNAVTKIGSMAATLEEIEKETQNAYDAIKAWCDDRPSRRVPGLYQHIIGPIDEEIAEIAIRKFLERRGKISQAQDSNCFVFTQLLGSAVKDRTIDGAELLGAHRNAYRKIKAEHKRSQQK